MARSRRRGTAAGASNAGGASPAPSRRVGGRSSRSAAATNEATEDISSRKDAMTNSDTSEGRTKPTMDDTCSNGEAPVAGEDDGRKMSAKSSAVDDNDGDDKTRKYLRR